MRSLGFKHIFTLMLLTLVLVVGGIDVVKGQECPPYSKRTYASRQESYMQLGLISNDTKAVDNDPTTASTLGIGVGLLGVIQATQYLEFQTNGTPRTVPAGTTVTIKISLPSSLIDLLGGITIQPFTNLNYYTGALGTGLGARWRANTAGDPFSASTLLTVLNGSGEIEVNITPTSPFTGVWINLNSGLGLGIETKVYGAYLTESSTTVDCNSSIDILSGVKGTTSLLDLASSTGGVTSPESSIDGFPYTTYSTINTGIKLLGKVYQTVIFNSASVPGDSINFVLQDGDEGLLKLDLLKAFTIQPYLKDVKVGSPYLSSNSFLTLKLIPGTTSIYQFTIPVTSSFDRVEISMEGVADVFSKIRVYDVRRVKTIPLINISGITTENPTICQGQILSLFEPQLSTCNPSAITYSWYQVGNATAIGTGTSITLPPLDPGTHTFVVKAKRTGCNETSESLPFKITVNDISAGTISGNQTICSGLSPNITSLSPGIASDNLTYQWQQSTDHSNFVDIANEVNENLTTITPLILATSYRRIAYSTLNGKVCSAISNTVKVTITPPPTISNIVVPSTRKHCVGVGLTYSVPINANGDIGTWTSSDPAIAKILDSERIGSMDNVFLKGISAGKINLIYTVENEATGCITSTSEEVTIFALPSITLGAIPAICEEQSQATLPYTASSENTLEYSIIWDNFPDTDYQPLPVSPISLSIPASASHGTYSGSFIIINKNGCTDSQRISITINPKPGPPHINLTIN